MKVKSKVVSRMKLVNRSILPHLVSRMHVCLELGGIPRTALTRGVPLRLKSFSAYILLTVKRTSFLEVHQQRDLLELQLMIVG